MTRVSTFVRVVLPSAAIAVGSLTVLGVLVGWVGASRAYSVGVHTLYADHPATLAVVAVLCVAAGVVVGRALRSARELAVAVASVLVADLLVALAITGAISELARNPEVVRAVLAESAGGLQIATLALGLTLGWLMRRRPRDWSVDR